MELNNWNFKNQQVALEEFEGQQETESLLFKRQHNKQPDGDTAQKHQYDKCHTLSCGPALA